MIIIIENFLCWIGMFIIEFPSNINTDIIWVNNIILICCPFFLYLIFYRNKKIKNIKKDKLKDIIISSMSFVIFRICMNYVYNNIMHVGDNYAIIVSCIYAVGYYIMRRIQLYIYIKIRQ